MDSLKIVAKGAGIMFIGMICSKLLSYLNRIIIARIGVEEYGLFSISLAIFGIFALFSVMGLNEGVTRYVAYYKIKNDFQRIKGIISSSLKLSFLLSLFLFSIMFIFSDYIAEVFFQNMKISIILKILSVGLPFYSMREILLSAIKSYSLQIEYETVLRNIGENFIKMFGTLLLISYGFNIIGAAYASTFALIITFLVSLLVLETKIFPLLNTKIKSVYENRELFSYSLPIMFSILLTQIIVWSDTLMIGYFNSVSDVGIYNAAIPSASLLGIFPQTMTALLIPLLCQLYSQEKKKEFMQVLKTSTKWVFYLNMPVFLCLILFGKALLVIIFSQNYIGAYNSLLVLSSGYMFYHFLTPIYETLKVLKKTNLLFFNTLTCALSNIFLNYLLIPKYGIMGGAIGTVSSLVLFAILSLFEITYLLKENIFTKYYLTAIICAIFTGIITNQFILYLSNNSIITSNILLILIGSLSISLIYVISLYILNGFEKEDKLIIKLILIKLKIINRD